MGTKEGKHSNSEESALFRDVVGDVQPVSATPRHAEKKLPKARAVSRRRDERQVMKEALERPAEPTDLEPTDDASFKRPGVSRPQMRELRRGKLAIQDEIDLHGCTRNEAKPLLQEFLNDCLRDGLRCVRVVHGKGLRSGPDGPVLKSAVNGWLRKWDGVLAFCPARNCDGGTGALYVLLKQRR